MNFKHSLLALTLAAASSAALALPNIAVLATGGTIAGAGQSATGSAYKVRCRSTTSWRLFPSSPRSPM